MRTKYPNNFDIFVDEFGEINQEEVCKSALHVKNLFCLH